MPENRDSRMSTSKTNAQSSAIMVNYRYVLDDLDANLAKLGEGRPSVSRTIAR
jgi:malonyl-CoA decarboxylase